MELGKEIMYKVISFVCWYDLIILDFIFKYYFGTSYMGIIGDYKLNVATGLATKPGFPLRL